MKRIFIVLRCIIWVTFLHFQGNVNHEDSVSFSSSFSALALAITTYRAERKDDITIYPPHYFNPFSWMTNKIKACKDYNTMTEQEALECRKAFTKTSYVIQYHAHTWQKPVFIWDHNEGSSKRIFCASNSFHVVLNVHFSMAHHFFL